VKILKRKHHLVDFNYEIKQASYEECALDSPGSGSVVSCCEYENEHCSSIKRCIWVAE